MPDEGSLTRRIKTPRAQTPETPMVDIVPEEATNDDWNIDESTLSPDEKERREEIKNLDEIQQWRRSAERKLTSKNQDDVKRAKERLAGLTPNNVINYLTKEISILDVEKTLPETDEMGKINIGRRQQAYQKVIDQVREINAKHETKQTQETPPKAPEIPGWTAEDERELMDAIKVMQECRAELAELDRIEKKLKGE